MRVNYKKTINEEIAEAITKADAMGLEIESIALSEAEAQKFVDYLNRSPSRFRPATIDNTFRGRRHPTFMGVLLILEDDTEEF